MDGLHTHCCKACAERQSLAISGMHGMQICDESIATGRRRHPNGHLRTERMESDSYNSSPKHLLKSWVWINKVPRSASASRAGLISFRDSVSRGLTERSKWEQICFTSYLRVHGSLDNHMLPSPSSLSVSTILSVDRLPGCTMSCPVRLTNVLERAGR